MIRPCGAPRDGGTAGRESGLGEQGEQDHPAHEGQEPEGGASQPLGVHTPPIGSNGSSVRSSGQRAADAAGSSRAPSVGSRRRRPRRPERSPGWCSRPVGRVVRPGGPTRFDHRRWQPPRRGRRPRTGHPCFVLLPSSPPYAPAGCAGRCDCRRPARPDSRVGRELSRKGSYDLGIWSQWPSSTTRSASTAPAAPAVVVQSVRGDATAWTARRATASLHQEPLGTGRRATVPLVQP